MMEIVTDDKRVEELLTRGVESVFVKDHLREALHSGKRLRVKLGIDPTGPAIHLGRAVVLRKLKAFQDLGHQIVLIIGDFTAKIADPSDKLEKRPMLTDIEIKKNLERYLEQIGKIIDLSKTELRYNSEWLTKLDFIETGRLLECFTVQQMSRRRNFKERFDQGKDVFVVEFIYPALQGYDSVMVKADIELGGFDQLFNLKAGRTVQKRYGQPEQDIMVTAMLEGTDGRKMSSSWGNVISLLDSAEEMYVKIMAVKDELIIKYFTLCTDIPLENIEKFNKELKTGVNPRDVKAKLAREITSIYHKEKEVKNAERRFISVFQKKEIPEEMTEVKTGGKETLMKILVVAGVLSSKSEFRRLVEEGAVTELQSGEKITDVNFIPRSGMKFKVGKHRFVKIR